MLTKKQENPLLIFWLLLYLIPYLFVIRSSNNIYLARFHGLQCSFLHISCKKTVPLKFLIFSSTLGTIATASFVPRAPSIKSFCIYLDY